MLFWNNFSPCKEDHYKQPWCDQSDSSSQDSQEAGSKEVCSNEGAQGSCSGTCHSTTTTLVSFTMGGEELKERFLGCKWAACSKDFRKMANKGPVRKVMRTSRPRRLHPPLCNGKRSISCRQQKRT